MDHTFRSFADAACLPIAVDIEALKREVLAFDESHWQAHFNRDVYRGEWSGIALRANGPVALYPNPNSGAPFFETAEMKRCPAVAAFLARLQCTYSGVRFLRLGTASEILEHKDYDLSSDGKEARLHVCVQSDEDVHFMLDGRRVEMSEGECWYIDVARMHSVRNVGGKPRIHLVVDCFLNEWLEDVLHAGLVDGRS